MPEEFDLEEIVQMLRFDCCNNIGCFFFCEPSHICNVVVFFFCVCFFFGGIPLDFKDHTFILVLLIQENTTLHFDFL